MLAYFLAFLGGIALFMYGMQLMGDGLQKAAGAKLQKILEAMTGVLAMGILLGAVVTAVLQALKHHFCQRALQKLVEFINSVVAQWLACCRIRFFILAENQLIQAAFKMLGYTDGNCQAYAGLTVFQITHVCLGNINRFCQVLLRHL